MIFQYRERLECVDIDFWIFLANFAIGDIFFLKKEFEEYRINRIKKNYFLIYS